MSCDPGEGTSDGRVKRISNFNNENEIKQEDDIKEEPVNEIELNCMHTRSVANEHDDGDKMIKSESETDEYSDTDEVKEGIQIEAIKLEEEKESKGNSGGCATKGDGEHAVDSNLLQTNSQRSRQIETDGKKLVRHGTRKQNKRIIPRNQAAKKQKIHKCKWCKYKAPYKYLITRHTRTHTGEYPFQCDVCYKNFSQKCNLNRHTRIHDLKFQFHCSNCRCGFTEQNEMMDHVKKCNIRQYECYLCKLRTTRKHNLIIHIRIHSGERPFICSICFQSFAWENDLISHLRKHRDELPYVCMKCGHRFAENKAKHSHEARCERRSFECHLCQKFSYGKTALKRHITAKHTGEKSFQCRICGKKFVEKYALDIHMATHRDQFPHRCSKCRRAFSVEVDKFSHEKICGWRQYQCWLCEAFLRNKHHLISHMGVQHTQGKSFDCKLCEVRFSSKNNVNRHMKRIHRLEK